MQAKPLDNPEIINSFDRAPYERTVFFDGCDSLSRIARRIDEAEVVLDVGVGSGALGRYLCESKNCTVDGIDIDSKQIQAAAKWYRDVVEADIDNDDLSYQFIGRKYDVIVCADVLEHLRKPDRVLSQIRKWLKPNGRVLVSIPNLAYIGLVADLLAGEFNYRREGLLDETHVRFFTRRSLIQFLQSNGFQIISTDAVSTPLRESEFRDCALDTLPPKLRSYLLAMPDSLTYQFIVEARPFVKTVFDESIVSFPQRSLPWMFAAQLYWRPKGADYQEEASVSAVGTLGCEAQLLRFSLPENLNEIYALRLDVADRKGYLRIYSITLGTGSGNVIWEWDRDWRTLVSGNNAQVDIGGPLDEGFGAVLCLGGEDPRVELPIPPTVLQSTKFLDESVQLEVVCGWPQSSDYEVIIRSMSLGTSIGTAFLAERTSAQLSLMGIDHERQVNRLKALVNKAQRQQQTLETQLLTYSKEIVKLQTELGRWRRLIRSAEFYVSIMYRIKNRIPGRERSYVLNAAPARGLRPIAPGVWHSLDNDPNFALTRADQRALPGGWRRFSIQLSALDGVKLSPKIYFSVSGEYSELNSVVLEHSGESTYSANIRFPNKLLSLRLDPGDSPGIFRMGQIIVGPVMQKKLTNVRWMQYLKDVIRRPNVYMAAAQRLAKIYVDQGPKALVREIKAKIFTHDKKCRDQSYEEFNRDYCTLSEKDREAIRRNIDLFQLRPLISVIMPVYNTPASLLRSAIESVQGQMYPNWELCISDDASTLSHVKEVIAEYSSVDSRIKLVQRSVNGHISEASNSALQIATGQFVTFLDHDDELAEFALYAVAKVANDIPHVQFMYSDEDKISPTGERVDPYFKPKWNPELFLSQNYLNHLSVYRTARVRELGGLRCGFEGSQDYDLALRYLEGIDQRDIFHIPYVLYHWRATDGSTALDSNEKSYASRAGKRALEEHFARIGISAEVDFAPGFPDSINFHKVTYSLPNDVPSVAILIPTRDGLALLRRCIDSLLTRTHYPKFEIVVIDNQSREPETIRFLDQLVANGSARVLKYEDNFNFSAINNFAVDHVTSDLVCLLNNDVEIRNESWLTEMVRHAVRPKVGAVGAKLYYEDGTIQHAGVVLGVGGVAGHSHKYASYDDHGYFGRLKLTHNCSAVTAACLLVRREVYCEVGGLDSRNLPVAFNDVDFCLRLAEAGYSTVWTPYAELFHFESKSRGYEDTPEKQQRFLREVNYMKSRWGDSLHNDFAYNPNLSLSSENFTRASTPRVKRISEFQAMSPKHDTVQDFRNVAYSFLHGIGIEVGARHNPADLPGCCEVTYADVMHRDDAIALFPEFPPERFAKVDFIVDLDRLGFTEVADETLDFVIMNYMIEQLANPIRAIAELFRIVKEGGYIVLSALDRHYSIDDRRPLTSYDHLFQEFQAGTTDVTDAHYVEFLRVASPQIIESDAELHTALAQARLRRERVHVWNSASFESFLYRAFKDLGIEAILRYRSVARTNGQEYFSLWQKS